MSKHTHVEAKGWCQMFSFIYFPLPYFLKLGLANWIAWLATGTQASSGLCPPSLDAMLWLQTCAAILGFSTGSEDPNSGLHACVASTDRTDWAISLALALELFLAISSCFPTVRAQLLSGLLMFQYHPLKVYFDIFKEADVLNSRRGICHVL